MNLSKNIRRTWRPRTRRQALTRVLVHRTLRAVLAKPMASSQFVRDVRHSIKSQLIRRHRTGEAYDHSDINASFGSRVG